METVKAQDLRILNYVFATVAGNPHADLVIHQIKDGKDIDNAHWYFPIPLTEDILLRLGFEGQMFGTIKTDAYKKGIITVHLISGNTGECQIALYNKLLPIFYRYTHQLQNLAYDLGQELTLNP